MMNTDPKTQTRLNHGFTLIELLVVIAVIAILATMFLPSFRRATNAAKSTACMSNLRQIGIGLNLYVNEFQEYPLYAGNESLSLDNGNMWDRTLLSYCANDSNVFSCPGRNEFVRSTPFASYGYNTWGTSSSTSDGTTLGLGLYGPPVSESRVLVPSDMLAIGDSSWESIIGFGWPGVCASVDSHSSGPNAVFCDGHVESSNSKSVPYVAVPDNPDLRAFKPDQAHAKRWNHDNQPHPETWPQT